MEDNNEQVTVPQVGMGATYLGWTDRYPYTVIKISTSGKIIYLQADKSIREDKNGMSESQDYRYERDTEGLIITASLRKDGTWRVKGGSTVIALGYRRKYHDYSF